LNELTEIVAAGIRWARMQARMTPEQWAREIVRLVPEAEDITATFVDGMESGEIPVPATVLVAAARAIGQPVSTLLGEMEVYQVTLPNLAKRVGELEERMMARRVARGE
jgi:hypothetical protein